MKIFGVLIVNLSLASNASVSGRQSHGENGFLGLRRKNRTVDIGGHVNHYRGHKHDFHSALERLMRTGLLQDISTYYDVILSGAETLSEVNAVLTKRDPHFVPLSQQELDILVNHWLFQMLAK